MCLLSCVAHLGFSQGLYRYPVHVYSTNEGLSQSSVYHIIKDRNGYVWAGTGDGLNRLTPFSIDVFKRDFQDGSGLSANAIRGLVEGPNGDVWIGTDGGLNVYPNGAKEVQSRVNDVKLPTGATVPVGVYGGDIIGVQQGRGFFRLNPSTGRVVRRYEFETHVYADGQLVTVSENFLWTATLDGRLIELNLSEGRIREVPLPVATDFRKFTQIGPIHSHDLYLAADSSIYKLNLKNGQWKEIASLNSRILSFAFVDESEIWVGLWDKGLCRLDMEGNFLELPVQTLNRREKESLDLRTVSIIKQADDGMVWLGVEGSGAVSLRPTPGFRWITKNDPYTPGLTNSYCRSIAVLDSNEILLGTYLGGMYLINLKSNVALPVQYPDPVGMDITCLNVWSPDTLFASDESGVWMLSRREGFDYMDARKIQNHAARRMNRIGKELVLASAQGLYRFGPAKDIVSNLLESGNFTWTQTVGDGLVAASTHGIFAFDSLLHEKARGGEEIARHGIKSLYATRDKGLWASTENGLLHLKEQDFTILERFSTKEGLPNSYVYGVLEGAGLLWGGTNHGLFSLDTRSGAIRTFSQKDGLQANEFNGGCFATLPDGRLVFGGVGGFNVFRPEEIYPGETTAGNFLKRIWINDKESDLAILGNALNSKERNFRFEWDVTEWIHPDKMRLECRLIGMDTGWVDLGADKSVRYTALGPGDYRLYARTVAANGTRSEEKFAAGFRIMPPLYQRWWFIAVVCLAIVTLLATWIYRAATVKYRRRLAVLERQKEMDLLRKRISRDIHDDVGSDLSKMRMLLQQAELAGQEIPPYIQKLQHLSDRALSGLSEVVWTVNSEYDRLPQMAAWFRVFAYDFFEASKVEVQFDVPEKLPDLLVGPDLRRNLLMIYKEGLNNVLKHARATKVEIRLLCSSEGAFSICWADDGVGFCAKGQRSGHGLANMRRRAEAVGLEWTIDSSPGAGTRIKLSGMLMKKYHESGSGNPAEPT